MSVRIGNSAADVIYAGAAPGAVAGVMQVNARVADGTAVAPDAPITVEVASTQANPG